MLELQRLRAEPALKSVDADEPAPLTGAPRPTEACPYKGLARFEASDAVYFFGREQLAAELVARVVGASVLAVIGPSGSGKSSLVRAGLLPALRDGLVPGADRSAQVIMTPGPHPGRELVRRLVGRETGRVDAGSLSNAVDGACAGLPFGGGLVLFVDQFEEVFTACRDASEREAFLDALVGASNRAEGAVTVVVTIRSDYYGHFAAHKELADLLAANQVLVGAMSEDELSRAIELPAQRAGLKLEPGLAEAMVADVAGEPGALPLLSTALLEAWEHRRGRTLESAGYHQRGGVRGAVARLAESAFAGLTPVQQETARRLLLRLADVGKGDAVVRRVLSGFLEGHGGPTTSAAFSPDGSILATAGSDGSPILWDVRTQKQLGAPLPGPSQGTRMQAAFPGDGRRLIAQYFDGQTWVWDIDPSSWRDRACSIAGRNLTQDEWKKYLPDRPYRRTCEQWPPGT